MSAVIFRNNTITTKAIPRTTMFSFGENKISGINILKILDFGKVPAKAANEMNNVSLVTSDITVGRRTAAKANEGTNIVTKSTLSGSCAKYQTDGVKIVTKNIEAVTTTSLNPTRATTKSGKNAMISFSSCDLEHKKRNICITVVRNKGRAQEYKF